MKLKHSLFASNRLSIMVSLPPRVCHASITKVRPCEECDCHLLQISIEASAIACTCISTFALIIVGNGLYWSHSTCDLDGASSCLHAARYQGFDHHWLSWCLLDRQCAYGYHKTLERKRRPTVTTLTPFCYPLQPYPAASVCNRDPWTCSPDPSTRRR